MNCKILKVKKENHTMEDSSKASRILWNYSLGFNWRQSNKKSQSLVKAIFLNFLGWKIVENLGIYLIEKKEI